jgi:type I site-specific restriction endonuclease
VEHAASRKTLVFLPLIATSKAFAECCIRHGLRARHIDGESDDRKDVIRQFALPKSERPFDVLCNAMLLTEGYDDPSIDCVIVLRPTRSRPLFSQMVGRGTRIHPDKKDLLLLDFLWLHERHTLIRPAHLIAKTGEEAESITKMAERTGGESELDLQELASETQKQREKALREELAKKAKRKSTAIDAGEFFLSIHQPALLEYEPEMEWETNPVTEGQNKTLEAMGIDLESVKCKGHASKIINRLFERRKLKLATPKQVKWLVRFKHPSPHTATFVEAGVFLDGKFNRNKPAAQPALPV